MLGTSVAALPGILFFRHSFLHFAYALALLALLTACGGSSGGGDTTAPTVSITSHADGATLTTMPNITVSGTLADDGTIRARVRGGDPLDETVLRSYCTGAAHMALSWVTSEALSVDESGAIHDLTIRSFGILRAVDMPRVEITVELDDGPPVNVSDTVFAAVAAAVWLDRDLPPAWPTGIS